MTHFKLYPYAAFVALCLLLIGPSGCNPAAQDLPQRVTTEAPQAGSRDYLIGWHRMADYTLIPVFKHNGVYHSVSRGFEVPLQPCPEGLVWEMTPSSMNGTTIGRSGQSDRYFIRIYDEQRANIEESFIPGQKLTMIKVEKPSGLMDAAAPAPKKNDDFLGWYTPAWFPWIRIEIRKDGPSYFSIDHEFREPDKWVTMEPQKLTVLNNQLGLKIGREPAALIYNEALKRFEITLGTSILIRMPLARISPDEKVPEPVRIGIPTWH